MLTAASSPLQASQRTRERERDRDRDRLYPNPPSRRGHAPQISISDDSHHVTEAIGGMYGDEDEYTHPQARQTRPLSFVPSPLGEIIQPYNTLPNSSDRINAPPRPHMLRTPSYERSGPILEHEGSPGSYHGSPKSITAQGGSRGGGINGQAQSPNGSGHSNSPPPQLNRSPSEAAQQHFAMTDLNSSAAVAQELSNLQAIRRMSMDVHAADPDLPSFNSGWNVPTVAPSHEADEDDPSRLFWVPASVHPELAPKAFETFIQDRVKTIKRSSLSAESSLSPALADRNGSLRRKKSMLSRQVNDSRDYQDGAERLERKRESYEPPDGISLQELEDLAHDPASLVRRLSIDGSRNSSEAASDSAEGDMSILGPKPPGQTLKRSTHTTYRRGSRRKGDRPVRRGLRGDRQQDDEPPMPVVPGQGDVPQLPAFGNLGKFEEGFGSLQRVQTEPTPKPRAVENFSRPGRKAQTPPLQQDEFGRLELSKSLSNERPHSPEDRRNSPSPEDHMYPPRGSSSARSPPPQMNVPTIVETPPQAHDHDRPQSSPNMPNMPNMRSGDQTPSQPPQTPLPNRPGPQRPSLTRPASLQQTRSPPSRNAAADQMANPTAIPGGNTRTDTLSIIPTYSTEEKKPDAKKGKKEKDDGSRKTSWSSFFSKDDDKEKEKEAGGKKSKAKLQRPVEKSHDNTRLDVLQASIDGSGKGRESLVLERAAVQVEPQPKQGGVRKPANDGKKEKDPGLFSSLFGGGKKKGEKDTTSKKSANSLRGLSPEPPQRRLQPDIDYNWSRFSILEERAIYRMAHIKLANPRRELYSQVLLSNFMYSYLAKVQQMHPQIQIPQSAAQKNAERKKKEKEAQAAAALQQQQQQAGGGGQASEEYQQYQRYQEQQARYDKPVELTSNGQPRAGPSSRAPPEQQVEERQYSSQRQDEYAQANGGTSQHAYANSGREQGGQQQQGQHWEYGGENGGREGQGGQGQNQGQGQGERW